MARIYGTPLASGATPLEAAERFRIERATALGVASSELVPQELTQGQAQLAATPKPLGLMYDSKTGTYKFWLYRYGQIKGQLPVFRSGLLTLVRNAPNNPVVWASSTVHDVSAFSAPTLARSLPADADKTLRAIRARTDFNGRLLPAPRAIARLTQPEAVVFAGKEGEDLAPRLAMQYTAHTSAPDGAFTVVADASTGDVLHIESQVVFEDIAGSVQGLVTQGDKAMDCADEVSTAFPYAEVTSPSGSAFSDTSGQFLLPNTGSSAVSLSSLVGGKYFDVSNYTGTSEQLTQSVTPPGPASFIHNPDNLSDAARAQANGYANANQVRDFLLGYHPTYPTISSQINFPVYVNRTDNYCPGNAWYDGSSINFCSASSSYGNTSFASVNHHEYGHHIVSMGGSGQGAYGEGMGDAIAVLLAGDPGLGYGFYLNKCTTPLRNADNTCQYSASACSSCGSEIHACGNLLSGTIWSIRKALSVSDPETYATVINKLVLNSIPLHVGSTISASIASDLITLDDDDGNIGNGSPHYAQICEGFSAHGMSCPPLLTGISINQTSTLSASGPVGGPFSPESVAYTLTNLGPTSPVAYTVAPLTAAPWLTIANASGSLTTGQQAQVTVSIDQAVAATLAKGKYSTTLQFTNQTDGVGGGTRAVALEVGVPTPIFSEKFEGGLGSFTLGTESTNLWHVSGSCASAQSGHSTPNSLYFGVDSGCNYNTGNVSAGSATSAAIAVTDTSVVRLKFNYYLQTEKLSPWDKASAQVSVNDGAFTVVASNNAGGQALVDGSGSWQTSEVDISSLVSSLPSANVKVRFAFDTGDSLYNTYTGFLVDDVEVRAFGKGCASDADCDDGAYCDGVEHCVAGTCSAGTPVACNDNVSCTLDSCDEASDSCTHQVSDALCTDGQACNGIETCSAALGCQSGTPLDCNDNNQCTSDSCDAVLGCQHTALSCDDGNACTTDSCSVASGCQHSALDCSDGNECTTDSCDSSSGCTHANGTGSCTDDGNSCTSDVCSAGVCTHPDNGTCGPGAFVESGGQVVFEAEHFSVNTARASHTWDLTTNTSASGGQVMTSNPNNGANVNTGYTTGSPQLNFPVQFSTTGTYYVWVRGFGSGSGDRTCHVGLDDNGPTTSDRISGFSSSFAWSRATLDGPVATITVSSPGVHTVNLWMREDGFVVDKVLLTTNTNYTPSGTGPTESVKSCSTSASCNDSNPCTVDSCVSGVCQNSAAPAGTTCADDGNACTNDVCSGTSCTHPNNTAPCADDGNSCTSDVCSNGTCTHPSNGSCGASPCASYCSNPVSFSGNFQSGNLGTAATCHQSTGALNGGNCGNFVSPRALYVNGVQMTCNNGNWASIPAKVNGGYCVYTTAGNQPWAYFATW